FRFPTREVLGRITPQTRLIAVANPNNPTGAVAPQNDLLALARSAPDAALLVDEAYFEFYGETLLGQWRALPNLFVARTFSKAYGLAGLRIGRSEEHTSELQSRGHLVCRLLLEKKKQHNTYHQTSSQTRLTRPTRRRHTI